MTRAWPLVKPPGSIPAGQIAYVGGTDPDALAVDARALAEQVGSTGRVTTAKLQRHAAEAEANLTAARTSTEHREAFNAASVANTALLRDLIYRTNPATGQVEESS
jgi:hypothetical protein